MLNSQSSSCNAANAPVAALNGNSPAAPIQVDAGNESAIVASAHSMHLRKATISATSEANEMNLQQSTISNTTTTTCLSDASKAVPITLHYFVSFHQICVATALLPLLTLFTCFVTAYIFQYDDVHETHCRVYNIVPSISAITGVSPQRYFWRYSIALHLGPRLPIAFIYNNYYTSQLAELLHRAPQQVHLAKKLIKLVLTLNCIEIASLGGVTYISNRENYPMHERIFITFMICSLCHMLATIKLNSILHPNEQLLSSEKRLSLKWKKILFVTSIISTIGLLIFFAKHRFYCHDLAFTWFAIFEYIIAVANLLFHFTIIWDFPCQFMLIAQGSRNKIEKLFEAQNKLD